MGVPTINNYHCVEKISNGGFGEVWRAINKDNHTVNDSNKPDKEVAIKIEKKERKSQLKNEYAILSSINILHTVPRVFYFGETIRFNYMVFELLGQSIDKYYLDSCRNVYKSNLTATPILKWIGTQMLQCIQSVHESGILHRDIKPQNFLLSIDRSQIYIVDFGLSTSYIDKKKHHKPELQHDSIVGSVDFISYYLHEGMSASRRDDLISMIYVIIYIHNGTLPWQINNDTVYEERNDIVNSKKNESIYEIKYNISPDTICKGMSDKINIMLIYCYSLEYTTEPNYEYIRFLFETM